ncbi:MAG: response regulator [Saccharofermentanales bacterium]
MYKLLIVDDEEIVRKAIVRIIDWQALGFSEVYEAENGVQALEIALETRPDLILADIRMPFMDGLELAGIIQEKLPQTFIVILSGHAEFEYAKKAIGLGVMDYILKPLGAASLTLKMQEIKARLDEKQEERQYLSKIRDQLYQSMPLMRERYLNRLVCIPGRNVGYKDEMKFLELPLQEGGYAVTVVEPDLGSLNAEDTELFTFAMKNIITESVGVSHPVFSDTFGHIVIVFSISELSSEVDPRNMISEILTAVQKSIELFTGKSATFAVGTTVEGYDDLYSSYHEALTALECKYTLGKGRIYNVYDLNYHETKFVYPVDEISEFLIQVKSFRMNLLPESFEAICRSLKKSKASPSNIKIIFVQMITELLKLVGETHEVSEATWTMGMGLYVKIDRISTIDEIKEHMLAFSAEVSRCLSEAIRSSAKTLITRARDYIRLHYSDEDLSLDTIAGHVSVSSGYLSALFKKEAGLNFSDYLTNVRMENAIELLKSTTLKTYEIAYKTGFSNPHYFSISFKKHTGLTPSEFRDSFTK